ncbi:MAG TPA: response regulator transcription factor [Opitutaceae bacterium]|nr:response regulator transcription factor [Opitutaceae bacterium]
MHITIAIVEDNAGIGEELAQIIAEAPDCSCVVICRNLQTALKKIPPLQPDVVIMDINLPDGSGIEGTDRLKRLLPATQFLMFTIYEDNEQIIKSLEAGASGYLLKRTAPEDLVRAIREIKTGGVPMTPEVARKVIQTFQRPPRANSAESLTSREEEILQLLSRGMLSKEIARELSISIETVNSHLKHIYGKLHVRTRTEAVIKFLR